MGAPAGSWTSGLTSPDGPDSYQWNYTTHKTHTSSVRVGDAVHIIASFIGTCTRASEDGEQSSPPLTYLTRCSMNLTEQFLFLKNPISEASANTTHTSRYRKQTHAWLWWYKAIPDTSSCALRLTHRQLLCLPATHKYNTAKEGRHTLVKHTRRCHVSLLTRCVRETGGQKHCILI